MAAYRNELNAMQQIRCMAFFCLQREPQAMDRSFIPLQQGS